MSTVMPGNRSNSMVCVCGAVRIPGQNRCTRGHGFPISVSAPTPAKSDDAASTSDVVGAIFHEIFGESPDAVVAQVADSQVTDKNAISQEDVAFTVSEIREAAQGFASVVQDNMNDPRTRATANVLAKLRSILGR